MKILNLYANIGGNRKYWEEHEITAVEIDPKIATIYQDFWPDDTVVVGDAHQYLLEHFHEFDFIWASPPCPTHSKLNRANGLNPYNDNRRQIENGGGIKIRYPDMELYQEIILLKEWFRGKWCVENVISYYDPLLVPTEMGGHYFWTNFYFPTIEAEARGHDLKTIEELQTRKGFDLSRYSGIDKRLALRDVTEPELGKHILEWAQKDDHNSLFT